MSQERPDSGAWTQIDLNDSILYYSERSPFARRVRLAFLESGIRFERRVVDVYRPNPDLIPYNLLSRVPTLVLKSGEVIPDSNQILELFYRSHSSPLEPKSAKDNLVRIEWSALSVGVMEKTVEYFLETLRPESMQDPEVREEIDALIERYLERLEKMIGSATTLIAGQLTQADLDVGSALGYLKVRYHPAALEKYPNTRRYLQNLEARPSFQETRPA